MGDPISATNIVDFGFTNWGHTINAWNGLLFLHSAYPFLGCKILDLKNNPMKPRVLGTYKGGDCHDSFAQTIFYDNGKERDIMFVADGNRKQWRIVDITGIRNNGFIFEKIGETPIQPNAYAHSNVVTNDGKTLFVFDERNDFDMAAYNISNLANPTLLSKFQWSGDANENSSVHNGFILGHYLMVAYYKAGLRVFDISEIDNIIEVGMYDTYRNPNGDGSITNSVDDGMEGAWNVYVGLPSGKVLISDMIYGLFVVTVNDDTISPTTSSSTTSSPTTSCVPSMKTEMPNLDVPSNVFQDHHNDKFEWKNGKKNCKTLQKKDKDKIEKICKT